MIYFYTDLNRYLLKIETKLRNGKEQKQSPESVFFFLKKKKAISERCVQAHFLFHKTDSLFI